MLLGKQCYRGWCSCWSPQVKVESPRRALNMSTGLADLQPEPTSPFPRSAGDSQAQTGDGGAPPETDTAPHLFSLQHTCSLLTVLSTQLGHAVSNKNCYRTPISPGLCRLSLTPKFLKNELGRLHFYQCGYKHRKRRNHQREFP